MPLLNDLLVAHDLLGPVDAGDADEQHREAGTQTQREGRGVHVERPDLDGGVAGDREVEDDEGDGENGDQSQQGDHLEVGPVSGLRIGVGVPLDVGLDARVLDRQVVAFGVLVAHFARAPFRASHPATRMRPPMPMIQPNKPSVTGPMPPRANPPLLGSECAVWR